jgi:multicomponent Na+:H+ antiporter subunit F
MFGVAIMLALTRLVLGPTLPDRIVGLDYLTKVSIGIIVAYAIYLDTALYLDVAIFVALISFMGTIAFAYYLEQRAEQDARDR